MGLALYLPLHLELLLLILDQVFIQNQGLKRQYVCAWRGGGGGVLNKVL